MQIKLTSIFVNDQDKARAFYTEVLRDLARGAG